MFIHYSFIHWLCSCDVGSLNRLFASSFVHRPFINGIVNERNTKSTRQIHGSYKLGRSSAILTNHLGSFQPSGSKPAKSDTSRIQRGYRYDTATSELRYRNALQLVDNQWCVFAAKISEMSNRFTSRPQSV